MLEALYTPLFTVLEWILSAFPDMPPNFNMDFSAIAPYLGFVGNFIDIGTFQAVFLIVITYETSMITVRMLLFLYRLLPFT